MGSEDKGLICLDGERPVGFSDKFSLISSFMHVQNVEIQAVQGTIQSIMMFFT